MASTSGISTNMNPSTSASTSDGSFLSYQPPSTKLAFQSAKRYHVFLSFRGPDVRKTLVDHLFEALSFAGLNVFLDTEKLEKGEIIGSSLERAIESSSIRIPIFSRGYAESTLCLREAAEMLKTPGLIIPLFYDVDPTHVRYPEKEKSPYCQAFQQHRGKSYYGKEEIEQWIDALHQICDRSGWSMDMADGFQARMVKKVVNDLIRTLDRVPLKVAEYPVGLDDAKDALIQKLNLNSRDEVLKVGIWGIGGIGKTTVAKAVYNQIYLEFEAASFVSNVRTTATESKGLPNLQKMILKNLSGYDGKVESVAKGISLFSDRLRGKRVLLVLDDVDAREQLKALVGEWLAPGSRVILTSRDKHIFSIARAECIHEMSGLEINEGLKLFSWYAFMREIPSLNYEDLSKRIVEACKGHPLSLEVIGSFLYDKHDDIGCWKEALDDITHYSDIYEILYISYSALTDVEKEIFPDIACFFIGEDKTLPIIFWESFNKMVHTAIANLSMKLLIKIDDEGVFDMHDHLRDMGRAIAEKEKKGTRKWEATHLSTASNNLSHLRLIGGNPQSLERLYTEGLRYLHLQDLTIECMTEDPLSMLPRSLIWLCLKDCSFKVGMNRAQILQHSRIVDNIWQCKILQINYSNILIFSISNLWHLRHLDLAGYWSLSSLPNSIGNLSQLQNLYLKECVSLSSLPNSIGNMAQLQNLNLKGCESLSSLPSSIGNMSQLQNLNLKGCESLSSLPSSIGNMPKLQNLNLEGCESSIGNMPKLQNLNLEGCESLSSLPSSIGNMPKLQNLNLKGCGSLSSLPNSIGNLSQLQNLDLSECGSISSLPNSIGNMSQLQNLNLKGCRSLSSLPNSIGNMS